ncbi:aminomethyl-transferring glycine dehydrogenase [soil metagenome]
MGKNRVARSLIGMGYADTVTPPVIQRNILENPGWYTAYTPYQAEIAQGRLEALMNFQTMVCELTGLQVANASLLDEGTAAAEAVSLARGPRASGEVVFVSEHCHPQTIAVVQTRCEPLGIKVLVGDHQSFVPGECDGLIAGLVQYPGTYGHVFDYLGFVGALHEAGALAIVAADLLALALLVPPGDFGADIAVGSAQRFGVPLGFGGPHAGYLAVRETLKRKLPGRLVGLSKDAQGNPAYRLSLQTREQHIRRDKATSNICTAQVLLAVMASMYAVYHGPVGLRAIARRIHDLTSKLARGLRDAGLDVENTTYFDTLTVGGIPDSAALLGRAAEAGLNLRDAGENRIGITLDERSTPAEVVALIEIFGGIEGIGEREVPASAPGDALPEGAVRSSRFLEGEVFNRFHTETEMLRYLHRLESRDLALNTSMIPLGSCTMKLNATAEMMPLSWPEVARIHPFAPSDQVEGYLEMCAQLEDWLAEITGFHAVSLQPNAGSQGEYAGLLAIRRYHLGRGDTGRDVCLIPTSAHGTNPASAVMAGMRVVPVACDADGNIDLADLRGKIDQHAGKLAALMVTYPSTHGVFEEAITEICQAVHAAGGQVYMDGANMNAQVGLTSPGRIGADVCHLNLHKTFCIPHGGGGPGVGPIGVAPHLAPFLPGHAVYLENPDGAVSSAPFGSASICTISWMYIALMGSRGLRRASETAILNANYLARRLRDFYPILYKGKTGLVAHECIIDLRPFKRTGIEVEDVAKRLMDYGYHAPTISCPVPGTMIIEPTECESREELDRFCDAMIAIHAEIRAVEIGESDRADNPLKHAPHTAAAVTADSWPHRYSRESAAFPAAWLRAHKFWPPVGRIDNVYGDRNLVCTCDTLEAYAAGAGSP